MTETEQTFLELNAERSEKILIRAMMAWIKVRFKPSMVKSSTIRKALISAHTDKIVALISKEEAWVLEQNLALFNIIGRKFLYNLLPEEEFQKYGGCALATHLSGTSRNGVLSINLIPPTLMPMNNNVLISTMHITDRTELITKYKETDNYISQSYIDLVPVLKTYSTEILTKAEIEYIEETYNTYKNDSDIMAHKEATIKARQKEEENLKNVLKAISVQGDRTIMTKLAITMFTSVNHAYRTSSHTLLKIRYGKNGAEPVVDFARLYVVDYDIDLHSISVILRPLIDDDIKIKVHENKILFSTSSDDPSDADAMAVVPTIKFKTEDTINDAFEVIGQIVSLNDVDRIVQQFLNHKYQNY